MIFKVYGLTWQIEPDLKTISKAICRAVVRFYFSLGTWVWVHSFT
jgi:hypothetical protein